MDTITNSHRGQVVLACCFVASLILSPSLSFANPPEDNDGTNTTITATNHDTSKTTADHKPASDKEQESSMGYGVGCTSGAVAGSVVPGIGTIIGLIVGCGAAWFW